MKIALIGYGNWGKKIFLNLKKVFQFKVIIFRRKHIIQKRKVIILNKVNNLKKYNFKAILCAANFKMHEKICLFSLKNKIPAFIEKPLTTNMKIFLKIKKINNFKKNIMHINYIYKKYIEYLKIKKNKKKIKKIILFMGSASNNSSHNYNLWDWGTHCLSILFYFNSAGPRKISLRKKFKNFFLKYEFKNGLIALCYFGNCFSKSIKILKIIYSNEKVKIINFNKTKNIRTPLINSLNLFFKDIKKKKYNTKDIDLSMKITKILIKLKNHE
jgi:predicted dehydrogenase